MSSKRDNSKHNNKKYMRLALNLASQNSGLTGSNPSVGSVIVKNNEIISVGITSLGGRPHSETNAIKIHLIESAPYFRFLLVGIGLLLIMRFRPQGILPEKIIKQ